VSGTYRDLILDHSLKGMDTFYLKPDDDLKQAMNKYTQWFDEQLEAIKQNVDQHVSIEVQSYE
jgi:hypothetical protein